MIDVAINLDKDFTPEVRARVESKVFKVYVEDGIKKTPRGNKIKTGEKAYRRVFRIRNLYNGPARYEEKSTKSSLRQVFRGIFSFMKKNHGANILQDPFHDHNQDIIRLVNAYLKMTMREKQRFSKNMLKNLAQAIVRNPILRLDYGSNSPGRINQKGFDRLLIDTGQLFNSIKGDVIDRRVKKPKVKK